MNAKTESPTQTGGTGNLQPSRVRTPAVNRYSALRADCKVPSGTTENSPRFQPWATDGKRPEPRPPSRRSGALARREGGRGERKCPRHNPALPSLTGLIRSSHQDPPMNRWAIFFRPIGLALIPNPVPRVRVRVVLLELRLLCGTYACTNPKLRRRWFICRFSFRCLGFFSDRLRRILCRRLGCRRR